MPLRIGTRASKLARWQAEWTADRLQLLGQETQLVEISTRGDADRGQPVAALGGTGVFTKEIQTALLDRRVDVAVHSLKDLPTAPTGGLTVAAIPRREDPADALISPAALLDGLPPGARIGTGSLRRRAQLLALRSDLVISEIRGNVDTRLRKLDAGEYDGIILAAAGLRRLGLAERITELLAPPRMLPAPGQGALAIECRDDDGPTGKVVRQLDDPPTRAAVNAERSLLARLEGGCSAPIAAWGRLEGQELVLDGLVAATDGSTVLRSSARGDVSDTSVLVDCVAKELEAQGAREIVAGLR